MSKSVNINVRTDQELRDAFYRSCERHHVVPAQWIRQQMRDMILSFGSAEDRLLVDPARSDYRTRSES